MATFVSTIGLLACLCGSSPREDVASEQVDLMEVNHFYDDQGRHVFDQVIFYDWAEGHGRHMVRAWRLVKNPAQLPQRNWKDDTYTALWHDNEVLRKVQAKSMRESWTQYDPELAEREYLPKERRKELQQPTRIARKTDPPAAPIAATATNDAPPSPRVAEQPGGSTSTRLR
jgi:hypothetical protein